MYFWDAETYISAPNANNSVKLGEKFKLVHAPYNIVATSTVDAIVPTNARRQIGVKYLRNNCRCK